MQKNLFSGEETTKYLWYKFKNSRWGRLYATIPWDQLEACLPETTRGPKPYFDRKGKFALMLLKHELGVSDEALIEHINTNECLQLFCNLRLAPWQSIRDTGIVSRVRGYLAHHADLIQVQMILVKHWKGEINFHQVLKMDAVCYEIGLPKQLYPLSYGCQVALGML